MDYLVAQKNLQAKQKIEKTYQTAEAVLIQCDLVDNQ